MTYNIDIKQPACFYPVLGCYIADYIRTLHGTKNSLIASREI